MSRLEDTSDKSCFETKVQKIKSSTKFFRKSFYVKCEVLWSNYFIQKYKENLCVSADSTGLCFNSFSKKFLEQSALSLQFKTD